MNSYFHLNTQAYSGYRQKTKHFSITFSPALAPIVVFLVFFAFFIVAAVNSELLSDAPLRLQSQVNTGALKVRKARPKLESRRHGSDVTGKCGQPRSLQDKLFNGVDFKLLRLQSGWISLHNQPKTLHRGSSSTMILPGSMEAEYADLSTPLNEESIWEFKMASCASMSILLFSALNGTALAKNCTLCCNVTL